MLEPGPDLVSFSSVSPLLLAAPVEWPASCSSGQRHPSSRDSAIWSLSARWNSFSGQVHLDVVPAVADGDGRLDSLLFVSFVLFGGEGSMFGHT